MKIKRQDTSIPVFSYVMDIFLFSHPLQLLITQHSLVQFFLHPVNEIGAAFVLPAFDISVEAVDVYKRQVQTVLHIGTDGGFRQVCHKSDTGRETGLFRLIVLWQ